MTQTRFACWKCGYPLWLLDPPIYGWKYHCQQCQHLTSPRHELKKAQAEKPAESIGIVAAIPCKITMTQPN